ncbi:MAG: sugar nucleotide-binding protein [Gammaproteobacteria bacterium]|nr:sugar nucleotide-binding protein [Gammaproteobacteria bacterium]
MKLLIAGAGTPTGRELVAQLKHLDVNYQSIPGRLLAASDKVALEELISRFKPDQLINFHTYSANSQIAIANAESEKEEYRVVNEQQTALLAEVCAHRELPLIHLSSCYVFDGEKKLGYNEQDELNPMGVYGKTAMEAEQIVAKLPRHIIIRAGLLFGREQCTTIKSWIKTFKKNAGAITVIRRRFSPTANEDLARVVVAVCQQVDCGASVWGMYHYCGLETKKESEFVKQVLNYASQYDEGIYQLLDSVKITERQPVAPEIPNTTLSSKKIFDTFGIKQRSWHGSLKSTIKSMYPRPSGSAATVLSESGA